MALLDAADGESGNAGIEADRHIEPGGARQQRGEPVGEQHQQGKRHGNDQGEDRPAAKLGAPAPSGSGVTLGGRAGSLGDGKGIFLDRGVIEVGRAADLVIADAPEGSTAGDALDALAIGDLPGISMILVDGAPVIGRSRNTAPAARQATVVSGPAVGGGGH